MLSKLQPMLDGRLGRVRAAKRWTKFTVAHEHLIHSAAHQAGPRPWESENPEIDKMLAM